MQATVRGIGASVRSRAIFLLAACVLAASRASAQGEAEKKNEENADALKEETKPANAPVEKSNTAKRAEDEGAQTKLPSVGGGKVHRFAERGVLELGGTISLVKANAFTQIGMSPSVGWFFIDYVQISILPALDYVKTASAPSKSRYSVLFEPSFHAHLAGPTFVFFGAGGGVAYEAESGAGLAIAPRLGINLLVGGSGVLKLAAAYVYTATKRTAIEDGSTDKHTSTTNLQLGATIAW